MDFTETDATSLGEKLAGLDLTDGEGLATRRNPLIDQGRLDFR